MQYAGLVLEVNTVSKLYKNKIKQRLDRKAFHADGNTLGGRIAAIFSYSFIPFFFASYTIFSPRSFFSFFFFF